MMDACGSALGSSIHSCGVLCLTIAAANLAPAHENHRKKIFQTSLWLVQLQLSLDWMGKVSECAQPLTVVRSSASQACLHENDDSTMQDAALMTGEKRVFHPVLGIPDCSPVSESRLVVDCSMSQSQLIPFLPSILICIELSRTCAKADALFGQC